MASSAGAEGASSRQKAGASVLPLKRSSAPSRPPQRFKPPSFFHQVMEEVVAQKEAKPRLAYAFSRYTAFCDDPSIGRPIPLVYGVTGSGKTFAVELCAKAAGLPFSAFGGGGISPAGYKGLTMRDMVSQHFLEFRSAHGVIFLDEVDKWCREALQQQVQVVDSEHLAIGLSKQQEALRLIEHERIVFTEEAKDYVELRQGMAEDDIEHVTGRPMEFDTAETMWIFAGAFNGLEKQIMRRTGQEQIATEDLVEHAHPIDFVHYGMLEEMANRVTLWTWTKRLTQPQISEILERQDRPKWEKLFAMLDCELELDSSALHACANLAFQLKSGPRGAKTWFEHVMSEVYDRADELHLDHVRVDGHVMQAGRLLF